MRIAGLFAAIALALAGYTAYWFHLAGWAEDGIEARLAAWRDAGYTVSHSDLSIGGFPYRIEALLSDLAIAAPDGETRWSWRAPLLVLVVQPWDLRHWIAISDQASTASLTADGGALSLEARPETVWASLVLDEDFTARRAVLDIKGLELRRAGRLDMVRAERVQVHARRPETAAERHLGTALRIDVVLRIDALDLSDGDMGPLGSRIETVALDASLLGPLPRSGDRGAIAAWRDAGGTIDVHRLELLWGPVEMNAQGTVALDAEFRPIGALTAEIEGVDAVIDGFKRLGTLGDMGAEAAKFVLGLMSETRAGDGARVVTLPLTAQDGQLYLGPVPIAPLSPLF